MGKLFGDVLLCTPVPPAVQVLGRIWGMQLGQTARPHLPLWVRSHVKIPPLALPDVFTSCSTERFFVFC